MRTAQRHAYCSTRCSPCSGEVYGVRLFFHNSLYWFVCVSVMCSYFKLRWFEDHGYSSDEVQNLPTCLRSIQWDIFVLDPFIFFPTSSQGDWYFLFPSYMILIGCSNFYRSWVNGLRRSQNFRPLSRLQIQPLIISHRACPLRPHYSVRRSFPILGNPARPSPRSHSNGIRFLNRTR